MFRLKFLLAILFLAAFTPVLHAQDNYHDGYHMDQFVWQDAYTNANLHTAAPAPWVADHTPSAKFPVLVLLQQQDLRYHWFDNTFLGDGLAHFYSPVGQTVNFTYDCAITFDRFHPTEFHARWVKHDTQLQIALRKPGTDRTHTCNIKPAQLPVQQAASKPPAKP